MKRFSVVSAVICIALTSMGFGEMNHQAWDTGSVNENLAGVRAFHEDKRPDMMPFAEPPDVEEVVDDSLFTDRGQDQYYANLWGWVTIPKTGTYTWHVHGDNHSVLYVSTDENWENVEEVATIDGWTNIGEWNGGANGGSNADSQPFDYRAGQVLAVWGIMVEGGGGDNLGIGWTPPGATAIEYLGENVSIIPPSPTKAGGPIPDVGQIDVARDLLLSWTSGKYAAKHDVYFGTSFEDVNDGGAGVRIAQGLTVNEVDPGRLEFGQTYYWRVDEVNSPPDNTVYAGKIWEFTVEPYARPITDVTATATSSQANNMLPDNTVNGSGLNALGQHNTDGAAMWLSGMGDPAPSIQFEFDKVYKLANMLVWNSNQLVEAFIGLGAKDVVIEYSKDGATWTVLEGAVLLNQAPGAEGYEANTDIDFGGVQAKFVRITISAGYGFMPQYGLSEVRFHYIPTFARELVPADGSAVDSVTVNLAWRAGREAASHEVNLGIDPADLALVGTTSDPAFTAEALDFTTTYYWSITEVNNAEAVTSYAGDIISFTTPDYAVVDDFDQYDDLCNRIFFTWEDGLGHNGGEEIEDCDVPPSNGNGGGSIVGNDVAPFAERTLVRPGSTQSLPLNYDNAFGQSETSRPIAGEDWTASGIQTLSLFFRGTAGNTGTLYVKINNAKITYDGNPADIASPTWAPWNIDLTGVSGLQNVRSLTIGVDGGNAAGMLYIDDIRLYPLPGEMLTPADPGTGALVAHYPFDGNTNDSSGNNYHGVVNGVPTYAAGVAGQAISLDGFASYVSVATVGIGSAAPRTIAGWAKANTDAMADWTNVFGFTGPSTNGQHFDIEIVGGTGTTTSGYFGLHRHGWEMDITANDQEWHHFSATFDGTTVALYGDGRLVNSATVANVNTPGPVHMGKRQDNENFFEGLIDDVRIYDVALSAEEIAWLSGKRTPMHKAF